MANRVAAYYSFFLPLFLCFSLFFSSVFCIYRKELIEKEEIICNKVYYESMRVLIIVFILWWVRRKNIYI